VIVCLLAGPTFTPLRQSARQSLEQSRLHHLENPLDLLHTVKSGQLSNQFVTPKMVLGIQQHYQAKGDNRVQTEECRRG
jgi:hypothetical protein